MQGDRGHPAENLINFVVYELSKWSSALKLLLPRTSTPPPFSLLATDKVMDWSSLFINYGYGDCVQKNVEKDFGLSMPLSLTMSIK